MTKHVPRVGKLPRRRRMYIYTISVGVWLTGVLWVIFHYFIKTVDQFDFEAPHPLEKVWLISHAAFSFAAVWIFGILWPNHIKKGWTAKARRPTGGTLFGVILWLIISGFLLYYLGSDEWLSWTSLAHWTVGIAAMVPFLWHLLTAKPHNS